MRRAVNGRQRQKKEARWNWNSSGCKKSFARWANIRAGHIVVPVGLLNAHHEPLNFFTVYRPQGEYTILPSTWHDTGVSFWGRAGKFRYEAQLLAGLDGFKFSRDGWINAGAGSPFEYKVANKYGFATRLDYYVTDGLRLGLSGYYGQSMHNTFPHDMEGDNYNTQGEDRHEDLRQHQRQRVFRFFRLYLS